MTPTFVALGRLTCHLKMDWFSYILQIWIYSKAPTASLITSKLVYLVRFTFILHIHGDNSVIFIFAFPFYSKGKVFAPWIAVSVFLSFKNWHSLRKGIKFKLNGCWISCFFRRNTLNNAKFFQTGKQNFLHLPLFLAHQL